VNPKEKKEKKGKDHPPNVIHTLSIMPHESLLEDMTQKTHNTRRERPLFPPPEEKAPLPPPKKPPSRGSQKKQTAQGGKVTALLDAFCVDRHWNRGLGVWAEGVHV
jgi:hypothetical protein